MSKPRRRSEEDTERVYQFIVGYLDEHNNLSPTQQEIATACHMSRSSVQRHLTLLDAHGRICWTEGAKRSIWLPKPSEEGEA